MLSTAGQLNLFVTGIFVFFQKITFFSNSHAIAGGFSPAMATFLYNNYGLDAAGLLYVVFGSLSVLGIYINYFCGKGNKEVDTGSPDVASESDIGSLEMQEGKTENAEESESTKDTPQIV